MSSAAGHESRPSKAIAILALGCVVSLATIGWVTSAWQREASRFQQADAVRQSLQRDVESARQEAERGRSASQSAAKVVREAETRAGQAEGEKREVERAAEELRNTLLEEREALETLRRENYAAQSAVRLLTRQGRLERVAHGQQLQAATQSATARGRKQGEAIEALHRQLAESQQSLQREKDAREQAERALARAHEELAALKGQAASRAISQNTNAKDKARQAVAAAKAAMHTTQATTGSIEPAPAATDEWSVYKDESASFALKYPSTIFTLESSSDRQKTFVTKDGKARIIFTSGPAGFTLSDYRKAMLKYVYEEATIDYAPLRNTWFVLSGKAGPNAFYDRVTFGCKGRHVHGWQIVYPLAERSTYDPIVDRMNRSYEIAKAGGGCKAVAESKTTQLSARVRPHPTRQYRRPREE
jgi:hypothetical protein